MLSGIENLDIMLGGNSLDREESISSNLGRRAESPSMVSHTLILEKQRLEVMPKMATTLGKLIQVASITGYQEN